jgi:hypothetical protein
MFLPHSLRTVRENVTKTLYLPGAKLSLAPLPTSRQSPSHSELMLGVQHSLQLRFNVQGVQLAGASVD